MPKHSLGGPNFLHNAPQCIFHKALKQSLLEGPIFCHSTPQQRLKYPNISKYPNIHFEVSCFHGMLLKINNLKHLFGGSKFPYSASQYRTTSFTGALSGFQCLSSRAKRAAPEMVSAEVLAFSASRSLETPRTPPIATVVVDVILE